MEKGKGLLGPSAYPHFPSSLPPTQAPEAVLCSSFIQGTCLHEVQPPSPRQAAVLGPSRVSSVPMGIGGASRPQAPFHPIPALFLFEETSGRKGGGEDDLSKMLLLLWGVIPFWMETPSPHWCLCHFLGLNLQPL